MNQQHALKLENEPAVMAHILNVQFNTLCRLTEIMRRQLALKHENGQFLTVPLANGQFETQCGLTKKMNQQHTPEPEIELVKTTAPISINVQFKTQCGLTEKMNAQPTIKSENRRVEMQFGMQCGLTKIIKQQPKIKYEHRQVTILRMTLTYTSKRPIRMHPRQVKNEVRLEKELSKRPMKEDKQLILEKIAHQRQKRYRRYITKIDNNYNIPRIKQIGQNCCKLFIYRLNEISRENKIYKQSCPLLRTKLRSKSLPPSSSKSKIVNLVVVIVSRSALFKPVVIMSDNNKRIRSPEGSATSGKKRCDPRAEATQPHLEKATQAKLAAAARLARLRAETEANRQPSSATLAVPPTTDALQEAILASQIEMGASATPRPSSFVLPGFEKTAQAAGLTVKTPNKFISKTYLATRPKNHILTQKSCPYKLTLKLAYITTQLPLLMQADIRADELQANLEAEMDAIINLSLIHI